MKPEELYVHAKNALEHSYCPYSNFPVGCAILYKDGTVITGVTKGYQKEDVEMLVVAGKTDYFLPPCCLCRQVLVELCPADTPIYLSNNKGELKETILRDLVPLAFTEM